MNTKKIKVEFLISRIEDNEFIKEHRRRLFTDGTWDEIKTHVRNPNPMPSF